MSENTAVATALEPSGPGNQQITLGIGLDPSALKLKIEHDKAMRKILTDYVREELKEGHHYSTKIGTQELAKPMLLDEGARNIVSLFNLFFGEPVLHEEWLEGDHYRVRSHIGIFNQRGEQIASGDALCSTRESKYAFRKAERTCPSCDQPTVKKDNKTDGGGWYCWQKIGGCGAKFEARDERITGQQLGRIDNPDIADTENTVLKISIKRCKTAAVRDLPVVSEIFAPDGSVPPTSVSPQQGKGSPAARNGGSASREPSPAPPSTVSVVDVVVGLVQKLVEKDVPIADLKELYLPAGVAEFADLSGTQAEEIRGDLVTALNAKLKPSH